MTGIIDDYIPGKKADETMKADIVLPAGEVVEVSAENVDDFLIAALKEWFDHTHGRA